VADIRGRCAALRTHPELGPARDDLGRNIRVLPMLGRVVVAYRVEPDGVTIVRVFYGGQDYAAIMRAGDEG
jgi:plasmid stabilization system protein ParE